MKHLVGKEVFIQGTGNNAVRNGTTPIRTATISKVARVFVTFRVRGCRYDEKYRMSGYNKMHIQNDRNGGYQVYESLAAIENKIETERLAELIAKKFSYRTDYAKLDIVTIKKVAELLGIE